MLFRVCNVFICFVCVVVVCCAVFCCFDVAVCVRLLRYCFWFVICVFVFLRVLFPSGVFFCLLFVLFVLLVFLRVVPVCDVGCCCFCYGVVCCCCCYHLSC